MKKATALILTLVFLFSFSACGALPLGKGSMIAGIWNFDNGVSMSFDKDHNGKFYSPSETPIRWQYNRNLDCFDCVKTATGETFSITYTGEKDSLVLHYMGANGYRGDFVSAVSMTTAQFTTEMPTTMTSNNAPVTNPPTTTAATTAWSTTQPSTAADLSTSDSIHTTIFNEEDEAESFDVNDLNSLKLKTEYKAKNGIKVTVNSYTVTETAGYVSHKINYTIKNDIRDSEILPGSFKLYYDDGTSEPQYGFFNYMYYGDEITNDYEWKVLKTKEVLVLEYNPDDSDGTSDSFFSTVPNHDSLHWVTPWNSQSSSGGSQSSFGGSQSSSGGGSGLSAERKKEIAEALEKCSREVAMIDVTWPVLEAELKVYKINKDASYLIKMQKNVSEINTRLNRILDTLAPYETELYPFYSTCEIDIPIFDSTSTAKLSTYITRVSRVKATYDITCKSWGV